MLIRGYRSEFWIVLQRYIEVLPFGQYDAIRNAVILTQGKDLQEIDTNAAIHPTGERYSCYLRPVSLARYITGANTFSSQPASRVARGMRFKSSRRISWLWARVAWKSASTSATAGASRR